MKQEVVWKSWTKKERIASGVKVLRELVDKGYLPPAPVGKFKKKNKREVVEEK
ncbi:MAG: hypothetical protein ABIF11_01205 [Nitrospirota bacterium]